LVTDEDMSLLLGFIPSAISLPFFFLTSSLSGDLLWISFCYIFFLFPSLAGETRRCWSNWLLNRSCEKTAVLRAFMVDIHLHQSMALSYFLGSLMNAVAWKVHFYIVAVSSRLDYPFCWLVYSDVLGNYGLVFVDAVPSLPSLLLVRLCLLFPPLSHVFGYKVSWV